MGRDRGRQPASGLQFVHQARVRAGEAGRAGRAGFQDRADADHAVGHLRQLPALPRAVRRQHRHPQGRFDLFRYPGRAAEDVGPELVPVRATGRAAREGEGAVYRGAQVVEVVQAQALRERHALQHRRPAVRLRRRSAEGEGGGLGGQEGEAFAG